MIVDEVNRKTFAYGSLLTLCALPALAGVQAEGAPMTTGTWINVTPPGAILNKPLGCQNFGAATIGVDPAHPADLYTHFDCQGIWKSTDYGATWTGPINKGFNKSAVSDCAGGITVAAGTSGGAPAIYQSCIRGEGTGFWKSIDGGVKWTRHFIAPTDANRQDFYARPHKIKMDS